MLPAHSTARRPCILPGLWGRAQIIGQIQHVKLLAPVIQQFLGAKPSRQTPELAFPGVLEKSTGTANTALVNEKTTRQIFLKGAMRKTVGDGLLCSLTTSHQQAGAFVDIIKKGVGQSGIPQIRRARQQLQGVSARQIRHRLPGLQTAVGSIGQGFHQATQAPPIFEHCGQRRVGGDFGVAGFRPLPALQQDIHGQMVEAHALFR